jgi:hypothetical protein
MLGVGKDTMDRALFHNLTGIHHGYSRSMMGNHTQIVRNEQHGHARVFLQSPHEIENLRLDGDIQGGGRFIRD